MRTRTLPAAAAALVIALAAGLTGAFAAHQDQSPKQPEALKKADDLFKGGKYQQAIEAYKDALSQDPNNDHVVGYIALSYNRLGDMDSSLTWMKRRVEIPGQSPSIKARVLTDMALLYWDSANMTLLGHQASAGSAKIKDEDSAEVARLVGEGTSSAQMAIAIAPRSVMAFNLLNLLDRTAAALEQDTTKQQELLAKADDALRESIKFFDALPQQAESPGIFAAPTVLATGGSGPSLKLGQATKKAIPDALKDAKSNPVVIEILVGKDGKVLLPRVVSGKGKLGDAALA
ncbi:MAG TPA: tetratricopeptide repeat protein, partial [Blastocatellia bacterium]|nr:tetratricopeptide repeat protein [Blastocatellia bacterium]